MEVSRRLITSAVSATAAYALPSSPASHSLGKNWSTQQSMLAVKLPVREPSLQFPPLPPHSNLSFANANTSHPGQKKRTAPDWRSPTQLSRSMPAGTTPGDEDSPVSPASGSVADSRACKACCGASPRSSAFPRSMGGICGVREHRHLASPAPQSTGTQLRDPATPGVVAE